MRRPRLEYKSQDGKEFHQKYSHGDGKYNDGRYYDEKYDDKRYDDENMLMENITKPARQSFQSCLLDPNQFTFRELTNLLQKVIIILMILSQLCSQTCISLCKQFLNVKGNIVSLKCLTSAVEKSG